MSLVSDVKKIGPSLRRSVGGVAGSSALLWASLSLIVIVVAVSSVMLWQLKPHPYWGWSVLAGVSAGVSAFGVILACGIFVKQGKESAASDARKREALKEIRVMLTQVKKTTDGTSKRVVENSAALEKLVKLKNGAPPGSSVAENAAERLIVAGRSGLGKVLWVDDDLNSIMTERSVLENSGIRVTVATGTDDAMDLLYTQGFDMVISDVGRPESRIGRKSRLKKEEGYVLLDEVIEAYPKVPFIFYSSTQGIVHLREARLHGAFGATGDPLELMELVSRYLD